MDVLEDQVYTVHLGEGASMNSRVRTNSDDSEIRSGDSSARAICLNAPLFALA